MKWPSLKSNGRLSRPFKRRATLFAFTNAVRENLERDAESLRVFAFDFSGSRLAGIEFVRKSFYSIFESAKPFAQTSAEFREFSSSEKHKAHKGHDHQMCWCKQFTHNFLLNYIRNVM